jgi:capping protein (actin filament) muscle Z-line, alpha
LQVIVSSHNALGNGRYYDTETQTSFTFDHITQVTKITNDVEVNWPTDHREPPMRDRIAWSRNMVICCMKLEALSTIPIELRCCRKSLIKSLSKITSEFYPSASFGVYPKEDDRLIAVLIVASKYSPNNYW